MGLNEDLFEMYYDTVAPGVPRPPEDAGAVPGGTNDSSYAPPFRITIRFCRTCGRDDRFTPFTGKSHFSPHGRCPGQPEVIAYELVRAVLASPEART